MAKAYISVHLHQGVEGPKWRALGIFSTLEKAKRNAIAEAMNSIDDLDPYDPCMRFFMHETLGVWRDRWATTVGVGTFFIQQFVIDAAAAEVTIVPTLYLNLDAFIKDQLGKYALTSQQARDLLRQWRVSPPYEQLMREAFDDEPVWYRPCASKQDCDTWIERHGST